MLHLQQHSTRTLSVAAPRVPTHSVLRPSRRAVRPQAADVEVGGQLAQLNHQLEALRNENARLKAELLKLRSQQARASAEAAAAAAAPAANGSTGAAAVVAEPEVHQASGPTAFLKAVERGVNWPARGSNFWLQPPRLAPMPVDIGKGQVVIPPRDSRSLEIVHFTAELAPIAKVGGLGDVVTGLARTCLARGHRVTVCMPFYECLPQDQIENLHHEMDLEVPKGYFWDGEMRTGGLLTSVWRGSIAGVPVVLIRPADWNSCNLFRGTKIYGGSYNEMESYLYFCRGALEYLRQSNQQPHVLHLHEWQTCAAAMLYWEVYANEGLYRPRVVLTIHNLDNTGECRQDEFSFTGMPGEMFATLERALDERTIGHNPERLNLMKGGLVYANAVTTVSPSYAQEMLTGGAAGWLRETVGRPEIKSKVRGILNGIDTSEWNPSEDPMLPANFNAQFPDGKLVCKRFLQKGLGLAEANKPVVAVITRLVPQKGIPLIKAALYRTLEMGGQFVLLGSGHCDGDFKKLAAGDFASHPDCKLLIMYSEALAHQIYGAADIVLVPSMFEPCGLTQMIGMRYGAIPVVRRTGGLADTVRDVDSTPPGQGNGYTFDGADERSLFGALDRAFAHYKERPDSWRNLSLTNMNTDLSWARSASDYVALYNSVAMP